MSNANEPAYPNELASPTNDGYLSTSGLTKRELFAAMAMQGFLSNKAHATSFAPEEDAQYVIRIADALLAELERTA